MSKLEKVINNILEERLSNLHTAMPCRVQKYDEGTGRADVVPLFKRKFRGQPPQDMPLLINLPTLKRKRKVSSDPLEYQVTPLDLEAGDIVLVVFAERALERALMGSPVDPESNRKHDLSDGIIVGVL